MKKQLILILIITLFITGCSKVFSHRTVRYSVTNHNGNNVAHVTYINESGENEFAEVQPYMTWGWSGDFKVDDYVHLQVQSGGKSGYIKFYIDCDRGDNEKVEDQISLDQQNIGDIFMTLK